MASLAIERHSITQYVQRMCGVFLQKPKPIYSMEFVWHLFPQYQTHHRMPSSIIEIQRLLAIGWPVVRLGREMKRHI